VIRSRHRDGMPGLSSCRTRSRTSSREPRAGVSGFGRPVRRMDALSARRVLVCVEQPRRPCRVGHGGRGAADAGRSPV
jgi:hypothetical protein